MTDPAALIARLSALSGPDRATDCEVAVAIGGFRLERDDVRGDRYVKGDLWPGQAGDILIPHYTGPGIDAALELVPAGYGFAVDTRRHSKQDPTDVPPVAWVSRLLDEPCCPEFGATPAIALLIAILRAKETER